MAIYILGVGPGDPDLLTIKAKNIINKSEIVYIPEMFDEGRDIVENIVNPHIQYAEIRTYRLFRKKQEIWEEYIEMADRMFPHYAAGKLIVFAIPGDGSLYSTAGILAQCLSEKGMKYERIPGIPSFLASANASKIQLADNRENFSVHLLPSRAEKIKQIVDENDTAVFMKISKHLPALIKYVHHYKPSVAKLIHKASMNDERIVDLLSPQEINPEYGHLSVAIIKK